MSTSTTVYTNARVFTGDAHQPVRDSVAIRGSKVLASGPNAEVRAIAGTAATEVDLQGALVTPGFIEGHAHMIMLGEALTKVPLRDATTIEEVQQRLRDARASDPTATRILGAGWRFDIFGDGERPNAAMLDEAIADVPVLLDANDLHSVWVNSAALAAMGIDETTPDPVGGEIVRDAAGRATGFLVETAGMQHAWAYLEATATDADRDRFLQTAFDAYIETGVTGATEMSFGHADLGAYRRLLDRDGRLPFPVDAHWLLTATGDPASDRAQIEEASRLRREISEQYGDDWLRIVGVKFILDGVIDACTAAMQSPFVDGSHPGPIWEREFAIPAAVTADAHDLQLALHAIGDEASAIALDMVAACIDAHGPRADRRPRVEHLEVVSDETIARMATLGVTASMQPVHCDPAIIDNWMSVLGDERAESGFPWHKMRDAGVLVALGTDAPTAPHEAPDNLFIAVTARSALETARGPYRPERVFSPAEALEALTVGTATAARRDHEVGRLTTGYRANLAVWPTNPLDEDPTALLGSTATLVLVDGSAARTGGTSSDNT